MDTKQPDVLCLAPCPFCGGGARRTTVGTNAWFGTGCDGDQSCPAHLRALTHKTQAEADAAWNRRAPAPASSEPVAVHTDPEGYQDGAWYWVKINGFGGNSIMAPAMYRANCGAWYSHEFIGISTRFLDVLGPCTLASDIYTAAQVQAGAPVVLPEPVAYSHGLAKYAHSSNIIAANEFTPDTEHADEWENLYTEQQVRAMLAAAPKPPAHEPLRCSCHTCWPIAADDPASTFMRFCPACGNKRCPKANDHRHACTGSNEPGQPGSAYQLTGGITSAQKGDAPK